VSGTGPLLPGATVGVLGSGQLGRMLAFAARRMGYRLHTFSPGRDTPTGQVADREVSAPYEDLDAVREFASRVDVVTFEFENVAAAAAEAAAEHAPVRPAHRVLHTTQNRLREKRFLTRHGFPVTPFREVRSREELAQGVSELGPPAVLKTAGWGYDGKGQSRIAPEELDEAREETLEAAWDTAGLDESAASGSEDEEAGILEGFVDFEREVSVVAARGLDGSFAQYGLMANDHVDHILDVSVSPAPVPPRVAREAEQIARGVLEKLDVVGVLCVEMFLTRDGRLLVNELAPRPHNSGHLTIEGHLTSQFEQQLRAVCGLPLGSTEPVRPAAMANLLGDLWRPEGAAELREPLWIRALEGPGVHLHLYGKKEVRPGRKMGHLTALGATADEARERVLRARAGLIGSRFVTT
jgi:5-(carboxyamino)imidazole ribonucleotide synthase